MVKPVFWKDNPHFDIFSYRRLPRLMNLYFIGLVSYVLVHQYPSLPHNPDSRALRFMGLWEPVKATMGVGGHSGQGASEFPLTRALYHPMSQSPQVIWCFKISLFHHIAEVGCCVLVPAGEDVYKSSDYVIAG